MFVIDWPASRMKLSDYVGQLYCPVGSESVWLSDNHNNE